MRYYRRVSSLDEIIAHLRGASRAVALTGAGVSTESGIPDFRSDAGLWAEHDPMEVASISGFRKDPVGFYRFWSGKFGALAEASPNVSHNVLARLEQAGRLRSVVTQNIDGLHQRAGSEEVLEVHGTFQTVSCLECGRQESFSELVARFDQQTAPTCPECGGPVKPAVVLFGEMLPPVMQVAEHRVRDADMLIVMGSSLEVYPVAGLVPMAIRSGIPVAILNRDPGPFDRDARWVIHDDLKRSMGAIRSALDL